MKNSIIFIIIIIVFSIFISKFILIPFTINGNSMKHTLLNGDVLITLGPLITEIIKNRFDYLLENRIVIVKYKSNYLIKRCIGMPGDTIIIDNNIYIVPKDSIFVIGDNINNSNDSRYFGYLSKYDIAYFPLFIYFSYDFANNYIRFNRIGFIL